MDSVLILKMVEIMGWPRWRCIACSTSSTH